MELQIEECMTMTQRLGCDGSLQLHSYEYFPKIGYKLADVMNTLMHKNQRGYHEMCKCCSVILDSTVYLLDRPENKDPIKITLYLNDGSKVLAFEKLPNPDQLILGSTAHQLSLVADDPVLGWTSTPVTPGKKI